MHGLTTVAPLPGDGMCALPEKRDAEEDREIRSSEHVWLKCDACGQDMRGHDWLGHCIPAQPVKIRVGTHHIGITK